MHYYFIQHVYKGKNKGRCRIFSTCIYVCSELLRYQTYTSSVLYRRGTLGFNQVLFRRYPCVFILVTLPNHIFIVWKRDIIYWNQYANHKSYTLYISPNEACSHITLWCKLSKSERQNVLKQWLWFFCHHSFI